MLGLSYLYSFFAFSARGFLTLMAFCGAKESSPPAKKGNIPPRHRRT
jgi:hypothetical protein